MRVQRHACGRRRRRAPRHRDAEQRVGAEPALVRRAVERDHRLVDRPLIGGACRDRLRDLAVDVGDRLQHALAEITLLIAVAQLERLAHARRCARRHCRASDCAPVERDVDFDCRIASRIENFAAVHPLYLQDRSSIE